MAVRIDVRAWRLFAMGILLLAGCDLIPPLDGSPDASGSEPQVVNAGGGADAGRLRTPASSAREADTDAGDVDTDAGDVDADGGVGGDMPEARCGDRVRDLGEPCDDGNREDGDGCDRACHLESTAFDCSSQGGDCRYMQCGDGVLQAWEQCDDANLLEGDGCDPWCNVEWGYRCPGSAGPCVSYACGDGVLDDTAGEYCDDGNTQAGDGCNASCRTEPGFHCLWATTCEPIVCGDGVVDLSFEDCDDGNTQAGDGCDASCRFEPGFRCLDQTCEPMVCGDGVLDESLEDCDDGNAEVGDGCSDHCKVELGFTCVPDEGCRPFVCGDGQKEGRAEECDDGNTVAGDGCSPYCRREAVVACEPAEALPLGASLHTPEGACSGCSFQTYTVELQPRQTLELQIDADFDGRFAVDYADSRGCPLFPFWPIGETDFATQRSASLTIPNDTSTALPLRVYLAGFRSGGYLLQAALTHSSDVCGDGTRSGDEQCDDGNVAGEDGCSADCVVEPGFVCDAAGAVCVLAQPGELCSVAEPARDGRFSLAGYHAERRCSVDDSCARSSRWFVVDVPSASVLRVSANSDDDFDGLITLHTAPPEACEGAVRTTRAQQVFGRESTRLRGQYGAIWNNSYSGTMRVFVEVSDLSNQPSSADVDLRYEVRALGGCGDFYEKHVSSHSHQPYETCDDGNSVGGDGCSAGCNVEANWNCDDGPCVRVVCGDAARDPRSEQCDDGNTQSGDGCSDHCTIEPGYVCGTTAPYCRVAVAAELCTDAAPLVDGTFELTQGTPNVDCSGCVVTDRFLRLQAPANHVVQMDVQSDVALVLIAFDKTSSCADSYRLVDRTKLTPNQLQHFSFSTPSDGTHAVYVEVSLPAGVTTGHVSLLTTVHAPGCGDGWFNWRSESCDDGNTTSGDGCSQTCELEAPAVGMVGDLPADAPAFADGSYSLLSYRQRHCGRDFDRYWTLTVAPGKLLLVDALSNTESGRVYLLPADGNCDTLLTSARAQLNRPARLAWLNTSGAPVTVLLGVDALWPQRSSGPGEYEFNMRGWAGPLDVELSSQQVTPACGDGYTDFAGKFGPTETCDDGNVIASDGCSATCDVEH